MVRRMLHCRFFIDFCLRATYLLGCLRRILYLPWKAFPRRHLGQVLYPAQAKFVVCDYTIENGLHYVKDVTMGEDKSTVHADNGPKIMAALRNTVVSLLRRAGFSTIAARMRYNSTHPQAALEVLSLSLF